VDTIRATAKTLPLRGNGEGSASGAPAVPRCCASSLPAIITGVLLVNFLSCSSVAITRKQGRAMAPFGSRRCCPVVEPHSARAAAAPARLRRTPPGFGLTLGSDGEGQRLRLLRPCRPERLHRADAVALRPPRRSDVSGVCILFPR
jgi:hypothetical protein